MSGNELQDENIIESTNQDVEQDIEHGEVDSDLATEKQEVKKPHVEFNQEQQEVFNKAIAKKTFELRETERRLEAERQERERYALELEKYRAPVLDIPPMPDPYEDGYEQKVRARDQAIALKAAHDAQNYQRQQAQQAQEQEAEQRKQNELAKKAEAFAKSAEKFGVKNDELYSAINIIGSYRLGDQFADMLLSDDQGALISTYLANNFDELEAIAELNRTSPYSVGMYIERVIKPKAQARKPKVSNAPEPTLAVRGNGAPESKSPLLKGVTYR